jgi:hypothetical protein
VVISYWIIPEVIIYLGKLGEDTILKYKWFFLAVIAVFFGVLVWVIYLKFLLAKKTIESQTEVDKFRMQLEFKQSGDFPMQLEYNAGKANSGPLIGWNKEDDHEDKDHDSANESDSPQTKPSKKSRFFKKRK